MRRPTPGWQIQKPWQILHRCEADEEKRWGPDGRRRGRWTPGPEWLPTEREVDTRAGVAADGEGLVGMEHARDC